MVKRTVQAKTNSVDHANLFANRSKNGFSTIELPLADDEWNLPDFPQALASFPFYSIHHIATQREKTAYISQNTPTPWPPRG